jgi:hypothetical protein
MTEGKKNILAVCVLIISFVLIFIGISTGETDTVFHKAVRVCLECIGLS